MLRFMSKPRSGKNTAINRICWSTFLDRLLALILYGGMDVPRDRFEEMSFATNCRFISFDPTKSHFMIENDQDLIVGTKETILRFFEQLDESCGIDYNRYLTFRNSGMFFQNYSGSIFDCRIGNVSESICDSHYLYFTDDSGHRYLIAYEISDEGIILHDVCFEMDLLTTQPHFRGVGLILLEGFCYAAETYITPKVSQFLNQRCDLTYADVVPLFDLKPNTNDDEIVTELKNALSLDFERTLHGNEKLILAHMDDFKIPLTKRHDLRQFLKQQKAVEVLDSSSYNENRFGCPYLGADGNIHAIYRRLLDVQLGASGTVFVDSLPSLMFRNDGDGFASLGLSNSVLKTANKNTYSNIIVLYATDGEKDDPFSKVADVEGYLGGDFSHSTEFKGIDEYVGANLYATVRVTKRDVVHFISCEAHQAQNNDEKYIISTTLPDISRTRASVIFRRTTVGSMPIGGSIGNNDIFDLKDRLVQGSLPGVQAGNIEVPEVDGFVMEVF